MLGATSKGHGSRKILDPASLSSHRRLRRRGMQILERLGPDISPEKAPLEFDLFNRAIHAFNGLFDRFSQTRHAQDAATRGDDLVFFSVPA